MSIDRTAALDYARKFWNRACDDDKIAISNSYPPVSLAAKRKAMGASVADGWEVFFVADSSGGEKAVFRRTVKGAVEEMPDPVYTWDDLDDCTHYVSRCLLKEGISLTETTRANELTEAMLKSSKTKTLALKTTQDQGQKVVDSGIFKPGDLVGYYTEKKGRYTHTAMFVGNQAGGKSDPGGLTCHSLCRFQGLTKPWNGADDDNWFLHSGLGYTLIHFADDDAAISPATVKWLPGWWKVGADFYFVKDDGHALSTPQKPLKATQKLFSGIGVGYYFEVGGKITFIWRKPRGKVQVEQWSPTTDPKKVDLKIDGTIGAAVRVF